MKKTLCLIFSIFLLTINLVGCRENSNDLNLKETMLTTTSTQWMAAPSVVINGETFVFCNSYDEKMLIPPSGIIESVVEYIPEKNNEANFGEVGMEYWIISDIQVNVKCNDKIFRCESLSERQK